MPLMFIAVKTNDAQRYELTVHASKCVRSEVFIPHEPVEMVAAKLRRLATLLEGDAANAARRQNGNV